MISGALKKLHDKHVAKFGREKGWIDKAAWKIGVTSRQMYLWNHGTSVPNLENRARLIMLSEMDDPYDPKVRLPPVT